MTLTREDALNILDTLTEWSEHPDLGPKELEELEVGLNFDRYIELSERLEAFICGREHKPKTKTMRQIRLLQQLRAKEKIK